MRISSSNIGMESERTYASVQKRSTELTITELGVADGSGSLFGDLLQPGNEQTKDNTENSQDFLTQTLEEMQAKQSRTSRQVRKAEASDSSQKLMDIRQQCLNFLLEILFSNKMRKKGTSFCETDSFSYSQQTSSDLWEAVHGDRGVNMQLFTFRRQYQYSEEETTTYRTNGTVKCADGREIDFNLNLQMSRSFQEVYEEQYFSVEASLCDPLIINLDGTIPSLSDQTFFFDLDQDGQEDEISSLLAGNAFLALDKNQDGSINDGSELFGTKSGNGFLDLAAYDKDQNGFLDEGDEIFDQLKIWFRNEQGEMQLLSLKEKGIGAIALQNADTQFSLTAEDNSLRGMVRRSGFFLYESGAVGSIQQVDLAKYSQAI